MEQRSPAVLIPTTHRYQHEVDVARTVRWMPVWKRRLVPAALVLSDVLLALLLWKVASVLHSIFGQGTLSEVAVAAMVPTIVVWVGLRALMGLYPGYGLDSVETLRRHVYAVFATLAILAIFAVGSQVGELLSRLLLFLVFLGLLLLTPFTQQFVKRVIKEIGLWGKPAVILSYKETGEYITKLLKRNWELGYVPIAVFDYRLDPMEKPVESVHHEYALADVVDLGQKYRVDTVIFAMPYTRREQLAKLVSQASVNFQHVLIIPNLNGVTNSAVVARNFAGTLAVEIKHNLLNPWALRAKRTMDLCFTAIGGALVLPLLIVLALLVYLESRGPVFYRDWRMGRDGSLFSC